MIRHRQVTSSPLSQSYYGTRLGGIVILESWVLIETTPFLLSAVHSLSVGLDLQLFGGRSMFPLLLKLQSLVTHTWSFRHIRRTFQHFCFFPLSFNITPCSTSYLINPVCILYFFFCSFHASLFSLLPRYTFNFNPHLIYSVCLLQ